jgi:hypothetical protein
MRVCGSTGHISWKVLNCAVVSRYSPYTRAGRTIPEHDGHQNRALGFNHICKLCVRQKHDLRKFGQRTLSISISSIPPWMPVSPIRVPEHMAHRMCRLDRSFRIFQDGVTIARDAVLPDLTV